MLPRRAFTLVELLVVITIIVVLMGLIMGGVMVAKRAAMRAKATSQINTLAAAVETYNNLNGCYPEKWKMPGDLSNAEVKAIKDALDLNGKTAMGTSFASVALGTDVYTLLLSDNASPPAALPATTVTADAWWGINAVLVRQLMSIDASLGQKGNGLILDPWNKPLRFRPSKWYPMSGAVGSTPRVDAEDAPNPASFQIWSSGADMKDEATNPGEAGDDLSNWPRKN